MSNITLNENELSGLTMVSVNYTSLATDVAELVFANDYDAAPPSFVVPGAYVSLKDNGTVYIKGRIISPMRDGQVSQYQTFKILGPWDDLDSVYYFQTTPDAVSGPAFQSGIVTISGNITTLIQTLISYAAGKGASVAAGIIDLPTLKVPSIDASDQTCAALIIQVMRWVPDAVAWFDYSHSPPKLNIVKRNSSILTNLTGGESINYQVRDDLIPSGVEITYVRAVDNQTTRNQGDGYQRSNVPGYTKISVDSAGIISGLKVLKKTKVLSGTIKREKIQNFINGTYGNLGELLTYRVGSHYPKVGLILLATGANVVRSNVTFYDIPNDLYHYCTGYSYSFTDPVSTAPISLIPGFMWIVADHKYYNGWNQSYDKRLYGSANMSIYKCSLITRWSSSAGSIPAYTHTHEFMVHNYNSANPNGITVEQMIDVTVDNLESPVVGLAAHLFGVLSIPYLSGSSILPLSEFDPSMRQVNLDGVKGPIQRSMLNLFSEKVELYFGPPDQLRPDDFFSLAAVK